MKTLFSEHRWMQIVFGSLFLIAGGLLIFISLSAFDNEKMQPDIWLSIILAAACFIFAVVSIMSGIFSLKEKRFSSLFPLGAIAIALGVVLCYKPSLLGEYAIVLIGAFVLAFAVIEISEAVAMIFFKQKKFFIVFFFVIGALLTVAGILSIIFKDELKNVIYTILGGAMGLFGVVEIFNGIKVAVKNRKEKIAAEPKGEETPVEEPAPIEEPKPEKEIEA